jgi:S1-C subfamily serine protease
MLVCGLSALRADTVTLKDGTKIEGIIVMRTDTQLVLKQGGTTRVIGMDDVGSMSKVERAVADPTSPRVRAMAHTPTSILPVAPVSLDDPVANSTVKVFTTVSVPDVRKPWAKLPPREETGSGFVIAGKRILTSAHVIEYATDIQIRANQAGDKIPARVVAIDMSFDLAVLKLDDDTFFDAHAALSPISVIPRTREIVQAYGYSEDSSNVTVLNPSVTTVDFAPYNAQGSGLMVKLNSELAPGTSGGPVTQGLGNVMGIACCRKLGGKTFSFVIPSSEIETFLQGISKGPFLGKPKIYDQLQKLENPALREYLGLDRTRHGVVVTSSVTKDGLSLLDWDVLTGIMGDQIDDQGTVPFTVYRVNFAYDLQIFGFSNLEHADGFVIRGGQERRLSIPLVRKRPMLIPDLDGATPSYFVFGPIVFSTVTSQVISFISSFGQLEALLSLRGSPLVTRRTEIPSFPGEQLVFVPAPFFPHKLVRGYDDPTFTVVKAVNGIPIRNLNHLVQVLRDSKDEFVTMEFFEKGTEIIVFSRTEMIAATDGILSDNNIRSQGSADTMAVWNAK